MIGAEVLVEFKVGEGGVVAVAPDLMAGILEGGGESAGWAGEEEVGDNSVRWTLVEENGNRQDVRIRTGWPKGKD